MRAQLLGTIVAGQSSSGRTLRRCVVLAVLPLGLTWAEPARASGAADEAAAEALFAAGKGLMTNLRFDEACAKLDASRRLSPGIGITMWLADCHEKAGRLASAWLGFRDAVSLARASGDSRAKLAEGRAAALEPRLARVRVMAEGFIGNVYRDDVLLPPGALDLPTPVDRGMYRYRFVAPNGATRATTVTVSEDGHLYEVRPADGEPATDPRTTMTVSPAARVRTEVSSATPAARDRTWGFVFFGLAAVGAGVGTGFGLAAAEKQSASNDGHCSDNLCDGQGVSLRDSALRSATVSTLAFAVALVAAGAGTAIFLGVFDRSSSRSSSRSSWGTVTW